jgi:hypothetical protein
MTIVGIQAAQKALSKNYGQNDGACRGLSMYIPLRGFRHRLFLVLTDLKVSGLGLVG